MKKKVSVWNRYKPSVSLFLTPAIVAFAVQKSLCPHFRPSAILVKIYYCSDGMDRTIKKDLVRLCSNGTFPIDVTAMNEALIWSCDAHICC